MFNKNHLKYFLPISSLLFSFEAFLGTILGYFLAKIYVEKLALKFNFPRSLFIPFFRSLRIKLHHWLYATLIILLSFLFQIHFLLQPFPLGCFVGIIWHDFQTDKRVFKIIFKKDEPD